MDNEKIRLNNKMVWTSEPYEINYSTMPKFVGRENEMSLIMASWIADSGSLPLSPLLVGDPGVGKNRIIYEISRFTGRKLYIFQGHEDVSSEDLACSVRFSDDSSNMMEYVLSPLVCAMLNGDIFFCDEIAKIRPKALALLVSVLDERRYIDSNLLGERVVAAPGFRFIAATNSGEVNMLPDFIRSRVKPVIKIGYPPRTEIEEIIHLKFQNRMDNLTALLERFWFIWNEKSKDGIPPTPRDAIAVFSMASSISGFESFNMLDDLKSGDKTHAHLLNNPMIQAPVSFGHLERAICQLYES
jgi:MoxR-like ATPase